MHQQLHVVVVVVVVVMAAEEKGARWDRTSPASELLKVAGVEITSPALTREPGSGRESVYMCRGRVSE